MKVAAVLMSMTGHGQGHWKAGGTQVTAEVRSVNNRHLKLQLRVSEALAGMEPQVESLVRSRVLRGSLQLNVRLSGSGLTVGYHIQPEVVESYLRECRQLADRLGLENDVTIRDLLPLPGVVSDVSGSSDFELSEELIVGVLHAVELAVEAMNGMRAAEGENMRQELSRQLSAIAEHTTAVELRAPAVIDDYRERVTSKLKQALAEIDREAQPADIIREVLLYAERVDVREEIVRLRSHVAQFADLLEASSGQGRKLDFLTQEMFRESNTIGAKANDALLSQRVVELKTIIEQIRELVQNVE